MPTIFTRIIEGELPGTFIWRDDVCVAFMSIAPVKTGHTLVVPGPRSTTGSTSIPRSTRT